MARAKSTYVCRECGAQQAKWMGQCPECGAWNALEETAVAAPGQSGAAAAPDKAVGEVVALTAIPDDIEARTTTGIGELDRVLGGGLVAGGVVLLGGEPGIGKSTLLLETASRLPAGLQALYVSGEESLRQVGLRAGRLGVAGEGLRLMAETRVEAILEATQRERPGLLVIDSIQTLQTQALGSAPGSVAQVRECAAQLVAYAKRAGTALLLVGHVTKEGQLAGPRVLEHMVDTVLYFESETGSRHRLLRAVKNRFGAANELGVFAMLETGLKEVKNPSSIFLSRHEGPVSGSVIMVTREGTRPLLVELQALVAESPLANPRRLTQGLDGNRLAMLLAVLQRHGGVSTAGDDVFVNVVGGVRITETASDLPVVLAALSSLRDRPIAAASVVFGELGLAGEIRPVPNGPERLTEAAKHGFRQAVVPAKNKPAKGQCPEGLEVVAVERLGDALDAVF